MSKRKDGYYWVKVMGKWDKNYYNSKECVWYYDDHQVHRSKVYESVIQDIHEVSTPIERNNIKEKLKGLDRYRVQLVEIGYGDVTLGTDKVGNGEWIKAQDIDKLL